MVGFKQRIEGSMLYIVVCDCEKSFLIADCDSETCRVVFVDTVRVVKSNEVHVDSIPVHT